jgi:hypothetical protein
MTFSCLIELRVDKLDLHLVGRNLGLCWQHSLDMSLKVTHGQYTLPGFSRQL